MHGNGILRKGALGLLLLCLFFRLAAQGRIRVSGYVHDADGNPVELVLVQVKKSLEGAMTNEKGFYSLKASPGDSLTLVFSCLGYNKAERIIPHAKGDLRLNVQMNPASFDLGGVSVTASRRQISTMQHIQADQIKLLPDPAGGSIESLVVTYAGVSSNNELSSQYSVRGGSYDENLIYVNGLEVFRPLLVRSGQQEGLSFVNPELTQSVNFSAGGFEARYGDKMSSVLDITYKKPKALEGSVAASLLGLNAYVGSASGKFTQVTGIRYKTTRSLLGTMQTQADYQPVFMDLQTYMTYRLAPHWEADFLGNLASNNYRFIPHTRSTSFGTGDNVTNFTVYFDGQEKDRFQTQFGALTLKYTPDANKEFGFSASAFNSLESESYDISGDYFINDEETSDGISPLTLGNYMEHARDRLHAVVANVGHYGMLRLKANKLQWGATAQMERIADRTAEWEMRDSAGYSLPHTADALHVFSNLYAEDRVNSLRLSGYLQDAFKFRTPQGLFTLIGGLRGSYWNYNDEFIFSPRASLGFIPNRNQNFTFRLAGGLYYQPPFYKELRQISTDAEGNRSVHLNKGLKSQRSAQIILGGDYAFKLMDRNFKFTAELYYKKLDRLNPYTVDNVQLNYYGENCAKGYAAGLDMKFFGEFVQGTDSWISLSLMKGQQTIRGVTKAPLPNNPGYNFSLFFQDYFPGYRRLSMNLRMMLSGRLPVTPPYQGYEGGYFHTTPYRRVDIGLSYRLAGRGDALMQRPLFEHLKNIWLGIDAFNLFDIQNANSYTWINDVQGHPYAIPNYLTGRQLNFRILVEF
ncbi:MAG: TonB-dependent receptor [Tannerella sp.]|jgi:hypothetical protein|nr:TonB-dependent receptor [Tannerella sp.]